LIERELTVTGQVQRLAYMESAHRRGTAARLHGVRSRKRSAGLVRESGSGIGLLELVMEGRGDYSHESTERSSAIWNLDMGWTQFCSDLNWSLLVTARSLLVTVFPT